VADIPDRSKLESSIANEMLAIFNAHRDKYAAGQGGQVDWKAIEHEAREKLAASLVVIYLLMLRNFTDEFDFVIPDVREQQLAARYGLQVNRNRIWHARRTANARRNRAITR